MKSYTPDNEGDTHPTSEWGGSLSNTDGWVKYETAEALRKALEDLLEGFYEQVSESTDDLNKRIRAAEEALKSLEDGKD